MKKATLLALLVLAFSLFGASRAQSQDTDDSKPCQPFRLDVPTVVDQGHRIYWKKGDCIIVDLTNNPFRYIYAFKVDETKIAEDDVLGSLSSLLGLKSLTATNTSTPTAAAPTKKTVPTTPAPTPAPAPGPGGTHFLAPKGAKAKKNATSAPKACTTEQIDIWVKGAKDSADQFQAQYDALSSQINQAASDKTAVQHGLQKKDGDYRAFLSDFLKSYEDLIYAPSASLADQNVLRQKAYDLQAKALSTSQDLTGDTTFESQLVSGFTNAKDVYTKLSKLKDGITGYKIPDPPCTVTDKTKMDEQSDRLNQLGVTVAHSMDEIQSEAVDLSNTTCQYKARKSDEYASVHDKVFESVSTILLNADSFETRVRVAPYVDPMSDTLTVMRDQYATDVTTSITTSDSAALDCAADPATIFQTQQPVKKLADIPAPEATAIDSTDGGPKPAKKSAGSKTSPSNKPASSDKPKEATTVVLTQPWIFGRARLILSGGITPGFLADKQYQRSTNSSGTAVVGLKTDQKQRITPMLYGHVLLGYRRHDPDAWYGTLGVTAKSDNQSTDPEFLVGVSRSVAQQRFFFTAGAYIGEKQKLDGGLQLGQAIPSSLTGELPVTKGYHVGFGFGISYRFTSTKDPAKDTSTTTTQKKAGK